MSAPANKNFYGLMAEFDSPAAILHAAEKIRDAGYRRWDTFTPFPVHGMDKVMKLGNSLVGWVSLAGGAFMFANVAGLIWFANAFDYPLIVGGKPMFSVPMTFVPSYIMHHPLLGKKRFELASRDKFILVIGAKDEKFCATETKKLLEALGGARVELVEDAD